MEPLGSKRVLQWVGNCSSCFLVSAKSNIFHWKKKL